MTKKRLTDLLQEETQKFTPSPDESAIEVTAEKVMETDVLLSEEATVTTSVNSTKSKTPTTADLEATIKDLQTTLEKYENQDDEANIKNLQATLEQHENQQLALQQEISDLKTALSEQKTLAERLAKELYETKKTALQLAESNSQLIAEMKDIKNKPVPEIIKETTQPPAPEKSKSMTINPKKFYRPSPRVIIKPSPTNDEFKDKTWLFD